MQPRVERFRCFLIGAETLLVECAETLLKQGHEILGVVTSAKKIVSWAADRGLRTIDAAGDYAAVLRAEPFDYLFSITHLAMVPEAVLALPTRGAINFHDGPLPRYAGLNTPVWALMRGETDYAVTWHYMTAGIDTGDVLVQRPVDIAADDTALSLNTKCFQAGIESFAELVGLLALGGLAPRPQDFSTRQVFSKFDRPAAAGVLDWSRPADELQRLVRALNHGRYKNPVASAKVLLRGEVYVVGEATATEDEPGASCARPPATPEPGTIIEIDTEGVRVACGVGSLLLRGLATTCGKPLPAVEFAAQRGLQVGEAFDRLTDDASGAVSALNARLTKAEDFWVRRLEQLDGATLPYSSETAGSATPVYAETRQIVPAEFARAFAGADVAEALACAWAAYLARVGEKTAFDVAFADDAQRMSAKSAAGLVAEQVPLRFDLDLSLDLVEAVRRHAPQFAEIRKRLTYLHDLVGRNPTLQDRRLQVAVIVGDDRESPAPARGAALTLVVSRYRNTIRWIYDTTTIDATALSTLRRQFDTFLAAAAASPATPIAELPLLSPAEKNLILRDWNATVVDYRRDTCVHTLIAEQAARTPEAVAVVFEDRELTYRELDERSSRLAAHLQTLGVGPDRLVGVHLERSENLVVAVVGVLKAGGAYLPLDPNYPDERLAFMIDDAQAPVIITENETIDRLPPNSAAIVNIDDEFRGDTQEPASLAASSNLAYVIYTSGSTGKPKGVMIEHRNVVNFFAGMDQRLDRGPGTWLAVTSLSFDIHVLELLWTLARGFKVVVHRDRERTFVVPPSGGPEKPSLARPANGKKPSLARRANVSSSPMDFSLFYFSADSEADSSNKYRLLLEGSKWADDHGFCAVWTPERHFHSFGGLYPNPAVTGAAVAAITKRVQIRAGSVVLPLHHPIRVAEGWQVVDNLSNGRVGLSVAAGWQPNDFVLMPENFKNAKEVMFRDLEVVRRLWRGEAVEFPGATGKPLAVQTLPRPIQKELPVWVTTAGNIDTYKQAGTAGANVLTHLLGQSIEELAPKIAAYREARAAAGFDPATGVVSLMLHTFVGSDEAQVRETVRGPLKAYLGTSLSLLKQYAWAFPAFARHTDVSNDKGNDFESLTADEQDALLEFAFARYYETSGLFGTVDQALTTVDKLREIGVGEIACLIDFGVPTQTVLDHLPHLNAVRERAANEDSGDTSFVVPPSGGLLADSENARVKAELPTDYSLAAQMRRHGVTHFQCTPSLARMLLSTDEGREAVRGLQNFLVGGEAFPVDLARELKTLVGGRVINMYGPTETTVWSTTETIDAVDGPIPIGRPIANTQIYILDARKQPVPPGVAGELFIAGDGVTRGYLNRAELTAERFVRDPFAADNAARMYRTGDLARWRSDGVVEFLGRLDFQVKIRGHRIELGEIEARLADHPGVRQCVVVAKEIAAGDVRLAAYYTTSQPDAQARDTSDRLKAGLQTPSDADLRAHVRAKLPEYMVPSHFVALAEMPLTPNGKIDRKALPALDAAAVPTCAVEYAAPQNDLEQQIAQVWQELLGREQVGVNENFFDIGGHSLLVVRMHRKLAQLPGATNVALTDLFRFPTIGALAAHLTGGGDGASTVQAGVDRAKQRRELLQKRRVARK